MSGAERRGAEGAQRSDGPAETQPPRQRGDGPAETEQPQRQRIVLADVGQARRQDRQTRTELTEQTPVGRALVSGLVRAQLALALRLAAVVAVGLGGLPLLFVAAPAVASHKVLGIPLAWLLLGVAAYPFLFAVGYAYIQLAQRNERDFTHLVERDR